MVKAPGRRGKAVHRFTFIALGAEGAPVTLIAGGQGAELSRDSTFSCAVVLIPAQTVELIEALRTAADGWAGSSAYYADSVGGGGRSSGL
jgi:hypothetical protein